MNIKMSNLNYNFDNNSNTSSINISFSGNDGSNYVNATVVVDSKDLPQGVESLDDLNRKQVQQIGREKLAKFTVLATTSDGSSTAEAVK